MVEVLRVGKGGPTQPADMVAEVTPEQVAASLARLEVQVAHLASAIDRLSDHLDRMENRMSPLERIAERAQSLWWTMTKSAGVLVGCVGGAAWLLEHGSKLAAVIK
jgi:uncharacterized coiled-coil protein SlyX